MIKIISYSHINGMKTIITQAKNIQNDKQADSNGTDFNVIDRNKQENNILINNKIKYLSTFQSICFDMRIILQRNDNQHQLFFIHCAVKCAVGKHCWRQQTELFKV